ncbi:MAG: heparinase II/III family protein [Caulobacterales bacterium]|jgi:uncharacterized heparinase superfamily protein
MAASSAPPAWRTLLTAAADEWRATPFYRVMLRGADADRVTQWGLDPRLGDVEKGREILAGRWRFAAEKMAGIWPLPWAAPPPSPHFAARLHSFGWLMQLNAVGPDAQDQIASLIQSWVSGFGDWHPQAWAPELVGERLFAWLCHGRAAFELGDVSNRPALLRSLGRQARHLQLAAADLREPLTRIKGGAALVLAGCAGLPDGERLAEYGVELLEEAAAQQFFSDGAHQSRAPEAIAEAMADCIAADDALVRRGVETPRLVRDLMPKLADMLRYLRLGDGTLACFHGGGEGDPATIDKLLGHVDAPARAFRIAPQSAFHRLQAGDTVLVMDVGAAPPPGFGERAHAGCLAFEMSCGPDRVFVNVGSDRRLHPHWRAAGRATNGHTTLIVDDALSAAFEASRLGRAAARPIGPPGAQGRRADDEDGARIEAQHEGYRAEYGLVHRRVVFLDKSGADLRGVDSLARPLAAGRATEGVRIPFAVRFHLHPGVRVQRVDSRSVRLETPSGAHWRMKTDAAAVAVEESIYLSHDGLPAPSAQVVLLGEADPNGAGDAAPNRVRWAFSRVDAVTPNNAAIASS